MLDKGAVKNRALDLDTYSSLLIILSIHTDDLSSQKWKKYVRLSIDTKIRTILLAPIIIRFNPFLFTQECCEASWCGS